jgi:hypothetical protein
MSEAHSCTFVRGSSHAHTRHHTGTNLDPNTTLNAVTEPLYGLVQCVFAVTPENWRDNHCGSHRVYTNDADDVGAPARSPSLSFVTASLALFFMILVGVGCSCFATHVA